MEQPEVYEPEAYEKLQSTVQPVYSLTEGLHQKTLSKLIRQVFDEDPLFEEYLPEDLREELKLSEYNYAVQNIFLKTGKRLGRHGAVSALMNFFFLLWQYSG